MESVNRQTTCPTAVRLFLLPGRDLASRSEYCSAILGVPAVGLHSFTPAGSTGDAAAPVSATESSCAGPQAGSSAAILKPAAVATVWQDTTLGELSFAAIAAAREAADADFEKQQQVGKEQEHPRSRSSATAVPVPPTPALARYHLEYFAAVMNADGCAAAIPLAAVDMRQVIPGDSNMVPARSHAAATPKMTLLQVGYRPGDPILFNCTRTH